MIQLFYRLIRETKKLVPALLLSIISGVINMIGQAALIYFLISLFFSAGSFSSSTIFLVISIGSLLIGLSRYSEQYFGHYVAFHLLADLRNRAYKQVTKLAPSKIEGKKSAKLLKMITEDIEKIEVFYAHTLPPVAIAGVVTLLFLIVGTFIHPFLGGYTFLSYLTVGLFIPIYRYKQMYENSRKQEKIQANNQQLLFESVRGREDLLQLEATWKMKQKIGNQFSKERVLQKELTIASIRQDNFIQLICFIFWGLFAWIGLSLPIDAQQAVPLIITYPFTFTAVLALSSLPTSVIKSLEAANRLFKLYDEQPLIEIKDSQKREMAPITFIEYKDVSFSYPARANQTVLNEVNFTANKGERIGIIGESGKGKSTLVKLLMRWYQPTSGDIFLNHERSDHLSVEVIRSQMTYLPQNPKLFQGTLKENLVLNNQEFSEEEIWAALEKVQLKNKVMNFSDKLETKISSKNAPLSSGERQRFELARAFLHESSVLILDEPTSQLDALNEGIILTSIKEHFNGIVICITHRKSTLSLCDKIYEVKNQIIVRRK